jgi:hypothetical protein
VHPLARQPLEVDIGEQQVRAVGKPLRFAQQFTVFIDQRLAIPGQIGRRFALAGGRVQVRGQAARRLLRHELMAIPRLANHDIRCRQVHEHGGAGQRGKRRRGNRHPDVLADLRMEAEERNALDLEQQIGAERHLRASSETSGVAAQSAELNWRAS